MKSIFVGVTCAVTVVAFTGMGMCIEAPQAGQAPKKAGVIERIKKAYSDFKNRDEKKEAVKKTARLKETQPKAVQPKAVQPNEAQPGAVARSETMTKEEMLSEIKDDLESVDEIFDNIPALKAEKDGSGKIFYTYNGVKLEEMNKEDLRGLFNKVGQSATRFKTERIQRQLETVRRTQQVTGRTMPARPVVPSGPPSVSVPPSPPSVPEPPSPPPQPSVSRPPSPPSAPPSTKR